MCNLNSQVLLNLSTADLGVYHNNESECIALCHLAALHSQQVSESSVAMGVRYKQNCLLGWLLQTNSIYTGGYRL